MIMFNPLSLRLVAKLAASSVRVGAKTAVCLPGMWTSRLAPTNSWRLERAGVGGPEGSLGLPLGGEADGGRTAASADAEAEGSAAVSGDLFVLPVGSRAGLVDFGGWLVHRPAVWGGLRLVHPS